jgi:myosin-5
MEDSGPYEIAEPRVITALETYTPSCKLHLPNYMHTHTNPHPGLQTPRLKRLAEIVSQQAIAQQEKMEFEQPEMNGFSNGGHEPAIMEEVGA